MHLPNLKKPIRFCERVRKVVFNQISVRTNNNARNKRH